ncbi:hypothetical protein ACFVZP_04440, partial [Streptomyces bottropensis]
MTRTDAIVVPELYVGYPGVAFGGYVAGVLADRLGTRTARVDFRGPVPVGAPQAIAESAEGGVRLGEAERPHAPGGPPRGWRAVGPPPPPRGGGAGAPEAGELDPEAVVT